jgi:septal ring factor EnvC (AmiA/AmiB activator)
MNDGFQVPIFYVIAMLGTMAGGMGYMGRQLLAAQQQRINDAQIKIEKQEKQLERSVTATEELRDAVKEQTFALGNLENRLTDQNRKMDQLREELMERRAPLLQMIAEWKKEHDELWGKIQRDPEQRRKSD